MTETGSFNCTVRLWAVIGPHNSGKSSTIGALAGFHGQGGGGKRDVMLTGGGYLHIHAFRQSVQESGLTPDESIAKTADKVERKLAHGPLRYYNLLLALRSDSYNGLPEGYEYLQSYIRAGWDIASLALLDMDGYYDPYARLGAPTCEIFNTVANSTETKSRIWIFGQVRNHFGWA